MTKFCCTTQSIKLSGPLTSRAIAVLCGLSVVLSTSADDRISYWDFEPGVRFDLFYDDNVRLSEIAQQSSLGTVTELYSVLARRTEIAEFTLRAAAENLWFSDLNELNTTDGSIAAAYSLNLERTTLGLASSFVYDSTLTSEEVTTGIVQVSKRRSFFAVTPSIGYAITERARLNASYTFQDVSYEDASEIFLSDYRYMQGVLNAEYDLSERLKVILGLLYTNFDSRQDPDRTDGYGGDLGFHYRWSEIMTVRALAGARSADSRTQVGGVGISNKSTGPIFQVAIDRELGPGLASISLERSLLPSGRGTLLDTTQAVLSLSYPLSERTTFRFRAMGVRNRNPDDQLVNFNDRDFLMLNPGLRWRLAEKTWLDLSYRYRFQDREVINGSAESNAIFIGFGHDWATR